MKKLFAVHKKSSIDAYIEEHGKYNTSMPREYIPYDIVLEHEEQCIKNHGQDVATLDKRGGLSWIELYFVLNDLPFKYPEDGYMYSQLRGKRLVIEMINNWRNINNA